MYMNVQRVGHICSIFTAYRLRVMFYTASLHAKNVSSVEHEYNSTTYMEHFAESAEVSKLVSLLEGPPKQQNNGKDRRTTNDRAKYVHFLILSKKEKWSASSKV